MTSFVGVGDSVGVSEAVNELVGDAVGDGLGLGVRVDVEVPDRLDVGEAVGLNDEVIVGDNDGDKLCDVVGVRVANGINGQREEKKNGKK